MTRYETNLRCNVLRTSEIDLNVSISVCLVKGEIFSFLFQSDLQMQLDNVNNEKEEYEQMLNK